MKYIVLLCDGMADNPIKEFQDKTPMEVAKKDTMNRLARHSEIGLVKTVPDNMKPGSDVANLTVLGYDPKVYYTGRSPLEAASIGIDLKENDVTFRCNLVTLTDESNYEDATILDYCADDISTEEANVLIDYIDENLSNDEFKFYKGFSYRHCLVWKDGDSKPGTLTPPHDITGKKIKTYIPQGRSASKLYELMKKSYDLLKNHPINLKRIENGKRPANSIWLWGEGTKPNLKSFEELYNKKGSIISAVDLLKGIAVCANMSTFDIDGTTGYVDTNYDAKLQKAVEELKRGQDFVYIHVEAPDECGHRGELNNKVRSIELIDKLILEPLLKELEKMGDYHILVCPDHPTPIAIKTHTSDSVPYMIYKSDKIVNSNCDIFSEKTAKLSNNYEFDGTNLIKKLFAD